MKILKIGAYEMPVYAALDAEQRYEPIGGEVILRAASGRGILQRTWKKTRIVTSGTGWLPSGLQALDFDVPHLVACIAAETVPAGVVSRQAILPAGRRSDAGHHPYGLAQLGNGQTIPSPVSLAGDLATVAEVAGAVGYQVGYYPLINCWLLQPTRSGPEPRWEIVAEEV